MDADTDKTAAVAARVPLVVAQRLRAAADAERTTVSKVVARLLAAAVAETER